LAEVRTRGPKPRNNASKTCFDDWQGSKRSQRALSPSFTLPVPADERTDARHDLLADAAAVEDAVMAGTGSDTVFLHVPWEMAACLVGREHRLDGFQIILLSRFHCQAISEMSFGQASSACNTSWAPTDIPKNGANANWGITQLDERS
jgi:hypothetical protein